MYGIIGISNRDEKSVRVSTIAAIRNLSRAYKVPTISDTGDLETATMAQVVVSDWCYYYRRDPKK